MAWALIWVVWPNDIGFGDSMTCRNERHNSRSILIETHFFAISLQIRATLSYIFFEGAAARDYEYDLVEEQRLKRGKIGRC